jgi:hypothetical protein
VCGKRAAFFEKYLKIIIMGLKPAENGEPEHPFPWHGAESSDAVSGSALAISNRLPRISAIWQSQIRFIPAEVDVPRAAILPPIGV